MILEKYYFYPDQINYPPYNKGKLQIYTNSSAE